jgi:hypothetical protein
VQQQQQQQETSQESPSDLLTQGRGESGRKFTHQKNKEEEAENKKDRQMAFSCSNNKTFIVLGICMLYGRKGKGINRESIH